MDIALTQKIHHAHERLDAIEQKLKELAAPEIAELKEIVNKLKGEIQAMKARMGKRAE